MTEIKRIEKGIARNGRAAYKKARENGNAFIMVGNAIFRVSADGSREKVNELSSTRVKAKVKKFSI